MTCTLVVSGKDTTVTGFMNNVKEWNNVFFLLPWLAFLCSKHQTVTTWIQY